MWMRSLHFSFFYHSSCIRIFANATESQCSHYLHILSKDAPNAKFSFLDLLKVGIIWYGNIFSALLCALCSWYLSWTHWKCLISLQPSQQEASVAGPLIGFCTTLQRSTFSAETIHAMTQILYRETTFTAKYSTQLMFGMLFIITSVFLLYFSLLSLSP